MLQPAHPYPHGDLDGSGSGYASPETFPPQPSHVYISILPSHAPSPSQEQSYVSQSASYDFRALGPRPIRDIDPTITFVSSSQVFCRSSFHVTQDDVLVHSEVTDFDCQHMPADSVNFSDQYLYSTTLIPRFWHHIRDSEGTCNGLLLWYHHVDMEATEPTSFTISQDIFRVDGASTAVPSSSVLSSVVYHLTTSPPSRSLSPMSVDSGSSPSSGYSLYSSVSGPPSPWGTMLYLKMSINSRDCAVISTIALEWPRHQNRCLQS